VIDREVRRHLALRIHFVQEGELAGLAVDGIGADRVALLLTFVALPVDGIEIAAVGSRTINAGFGVSAISPIDVSLPVEG
jgi:hypothetical protein